MKCSKCGFENDDGKKFCSSCGKRLFSEHQKERKKSNIHNKILTAAACFLAIVMIFNFIYMENLRKSIGEIEEYNQLQTNN